jgi:branched-chain amino acid transport system permease protein
MRETIASLLIWSTTCAAVALLLGYGKPAQVVGMFMVSGMAVGALYALGGIGLVLLYRATGILNLSAGAIGALTVFCAWQMVQWGLPGPASWLLALLLAVLVAVAFGRGIAPSMAWREPVVKAVATLGYALVLLGIVSFFWSDDPRKFELPTDKIGVMIMGLRVTATRLMVIVASILFVVLITLALERTRMGLSMRALANNRRLSSLIGIPIVRVETVAWSVSGLVFGFTGLMFGDLVRMEPVAITFLVIPCIAAAICGRLQSLPLVLIGGMGIGVIESLLTFSDTFKAVRPMAPYVVAIIVLLVMNAGRKLTFAGAD